MKDKLEYFECECRSPEHRLVFEIDLEPDDDCQLVASVFIHHWNPWWKRVWVALKYILGYKCKYGHFDTFLLRSEDIGRLKHLCEICEANART
jgi:hypothetical protein